jgi:mannose-6-phosphate isomerase-like protein (cupin superfamily)
MVARFAPMGPVVYTVVELAETGSGGTSLEAPCTNPHWGLILSGEMEVVRDDLAPVRLTSGQVFHVPAGDPPHRFRAPGRLTAVGFVPLDGPAIDDRAIEQADFEQAGFEQAGFELVDEPGMAPTLAPSVGITVAEASKVVALRRGQISTDASLMGPWVLSATRFGGVSGYATAWCDQPHWGTVLRGTIAIEWEDEVEIISAGDAYYCPAGPPGHRIEVTDAATIIDFTPVEALIRPGRVAEWRPRLGIAAPDGLASVVTADR